MIDANEFQHQLLSVAAQIPATEFFKTNAEENDLHPDPRALRDQLLALRARVERLEILAGLRNQNGMPAHDHPTIR